MLISFPKIVFADEAVIIICKYYCCVVKKHYYSLKSISNVT